MKKYLYILTALFLITSCKHKTDEFDGPNLNDLYGEFYVISNLQISNKTPDFSSGEDVVFNAELSKRTPWVIEITGLSSGAYATIEGNDRVINIDNASWNGGANAFPGFGIEKAQVKLMFQNEDDVFDELDTIDIKSLKVDKGFLITGFENGFGDTWERFNQTTVSGDIRCGDGLSAKGDCYYSWNGTVGWDWAHGNVTVRPGEQGFGLPNNANNLFFNCAVKAVESIGDNNSFILFWFDEDDNGDGVFDPNTEDQFIYEYWTEDSSWRLFSYKYADLQFDAEGNQVETNGNGLPEPSKLIGVTAFFLSNPNNGNANALVDHMIFTENEPYRP